jgi:hypothetical protein
MTRSQGSHCRLRRAGACVCRMYLTMLDSGTVDAVVICVPSYLHTRWDRRPPSLTTAKARRQWQGRDREQRDRHSDAADEA